MKQKNVLIDRQVVGAGSKVFVVAEVGINHGGSLSQSRQLIDAAAECGADAVKFQTFHADRLMIPTRDRLSQQEPGVESAYQMFRRMELSYEDQEKLKGHADSRGIIFLSTPFDEEAVDFLHRIGVPAFKIASSDLTHVALLKHVASKGRPVILSTGMSYLSEVADAVWTLKSGGASELVLMHCVSQYPAGAESLNLRSIQTLQEYFEMPVGYSDHTVGIVAPLIAASLGATIIEKHFTLDKQARGPDHKLSADPDELRLLIQQLRSVETSLGDGRKRPADVEEEPRLLGRRSIVAAVDIRAHETVTNWMLAYKRPGTGLEPRQAENLIGMKARRNISKDTILQWEDLAPQAGEDSGANMVTEPAGHSVLNPRTLSASKNHA
jgi:N,N'-diacetyllegionaminate synthase